jgi:hypothetical protein
MASLRYEDIDEAPEELQHALNTIALTENPMIVGSARYESHEYPGDIDVFDRAVSKAGREAALDEFAAGLSNIARTISIDDDIQMTDFKAGYDPRFAYSGETRASQMAFIDRLRRQRLISNNKAESLRKLSHDDFVTEMRRYEFPRWTLDELIQGFKVLRGDKVLTLRDAIAMDQIVKLDSAVWFDSRMQAVEILYLLGYTENGEEKFFYDLGDFQASLIADINEFKGNNPLKVLKRLNSLSTLLDCEELIQALEPTFSSDAAALNQIIADTETLQLIREPLDKIVFVTLEFQKRLRNHLTPEEFNLYFKDIVRYSDEIYKMYQDTVKKGKPFNYAKLNAYLKYIQRNVQPIVNEKAQPFYDQIQNGVGFCVNTQQLLAL